ncbi:MAG: archaeal heat shock protein Hsp20 [Candidatus Micrarchaeia archaeon]
MAKKKQNGGPSSGKDGNAGNFEELDLNNINKFISRFLEHADKQFAKTSALDQPIVFGFNIKIGESGSPTVESFGNVGMQNEHVTLSENREPLVDVIDKSREITVIAEMPGVSERDIHVEFDGKSMEISASNKDRSYHKVVPLGSEVDEKSYSLKYNNGVLEITMRKK